MSNERSTIPGDLADKVLFASDRTCCICRTERTKIQIHHIDEDASNNTFENLAVVCLHCHCDAHATAPFIRRLTPDQFRLYNESWREIVKYRLLAQPHSTYRCELLAEAFLEVDLACHSWAAMFRELLQQWPEAMVRDKERDFWEKLTAYCIPACDEEDKERFAVLFRETIVEVQEALDRVTLIFRDVLPDDFRLLLVRGHRALGVERRVYQFYMGIYFGKNSPLLRDRFSTTIQHLCDMSREASQRRKSLLNADALAEDARFDPPLHPLLPLKMNTVVAADALASKLSQHDGGRNDVMSNYARGT